MRATFFTLSAENVMSVTYRLSAAALKMAVIDNVGAG
jgi:hypothetical protein